MSSLRIILFIFGFTLWGQAHAMTCPDNSRLIFTNDSEENKNLSVCFNGRQFFINESTQPSWEEIPALGFSDEPSVYDRVREAVGTEVAEKNFSPVYRQSMDSYALGLQDRVIETLVSDQVFTLTDLNSSRLGELGFNCDQGFLGFESFTDQWAANESQVRCRVAARQLPNDLLKNLTENQTAIGIISLKEILKANSDVLLTIRSRLNGESLEINSKSSIPLSSFTQFDLIISDENGEQTVIGHCLDINENLFSFDINKGNDLHYENSWRYKSQEESDGFSARLTDSWRLPLSLNVREDVIRNRDGERVDSLNLGLNTGLLYEREYNSGQRIQIRPEFGIPLLDNITEPNDVFRGDSYQSPIPNTFKIMVQIRL